MDKAIKKSRVTVYLIIGAILLIIIAAAAIYFLSGNRAEEKPLRGTYVMAESEVIIL